MEKEPGFEGELGLYNPEIDPGRYFRTVADSTDDTDSSHDTAGPGFEGPEYNQAIADYMASHGLAPIEDKE